MSEKVRDQIQTLQTHRDPEVRRQAAEDLVESTTFEAINALAQALTDNDLGVRESASRSLVTIGGLEVASAIAPYITHEESTLRDLVADLLCRLDKDSIRAVEPYLHNPDQNVRKRAVDILGLLKHNAAVTAIIPLLYDSEPDVVLSAVEALENIGDESALPHLIQLFEQEEYTRSAVVKALGKIGGSIARDFLCKSFQKAIADRSDPLTMFAIIEALGLIGDNEAFSLLSTYLPATEGKFRQAMLAAMIWIADKSAMPLNIPSASTQDFIDLLQDDDLRVQLNAVKALSGVPDDHVTKAFINTLGISEYVNVVLFGLLESRDDAFPFILEKLGDSSCKGKKDLISLLRTIARRATENTDPAIEQVMLDRAFEVVKGHWESADEGSRAAIVETMLILNGGRALSVLEHLMNDPDPWLRTRLIELLGTLDDGRIPEFISRYSNDEDEMVRTTVDWVLEYKDCSVNDDNQNKLT